METGIDTSINKRLIYQAVAVGMKAIEQGVAREKMSREELTKQAERMIKQSREMTTLLMKASLIPPAPDIL